MDRATSTQAAQTPFAGFGAGALPFFEALAGEQNRDWFRANRATYERDIRGPLAALVDALAFAHAAHDVPLTGDAKRSLFRINRDVRFSNDKSPYKTNAGAVMTRDGSKAAPGLLYIQVGGAEGSFTGAGFYGLEPKDLAAIRRAIADAPAKWLSIEATLAEAGLAFSRGAALARPPKGFERYADSPVGPALKLRNLIVSRPISAERLAKPDLVGDILAFSIAALPLLRFGWSALDRARGQDLVAR